MRFLYFKLAKKEDAKEGAIDAIKVVKVLKLTASEFKFLSENKPRLSTHNITLEFVTWKHTLSISCNNNEQAKGIHDAEQEIAALLEARRKEEMKHESVTITNHTFNFIADLPSSFLQEVPSFFETKEKVLPIPSNKRLGRFFSGSLQYDIAIRDFFAICEPEGYNYPSQAEAAKALTLEINKLCQFHAEDIFRFIAKRDSICSYIPMHLFFSLFLHLPVDKTPKLLDDYKHMLKPMDRFDCATNMKCIWHFSEDAIKILLQHEKIRRLFVASLKNVDFAEYACVNGLRVVMADQALKQVCQQKRYFDFIYRLACLNNKQEVMDFFLQEAPPGIRDSVVASKTAFDQQLIAALLEDEEIDENVEQSVQTDSDADLFESEEEDNTNASATDTSVFPTLRPFS